MYKRNDLLYINLFRYILHLNITINRFSQLIEYNEHLKVSITLSYCWQLCFKSFSLIFLQLTDEVVRKKSEYQKHLEGYKALRTRFEEFYIKGVCAKS